MSGKREYMQRWLSFHYYNIPQQSDFYYLEICNEIFNLLRDVDFPDEEIPISDEQKKDLACFITGYFEDVISGTGLWKAFITQHNELYGTYLPFFETDPEEYYPNEINAEDICFLIWYCLSMVLEELIISPTVYEWNDITKGIIDILEREYETAPENFNLKQIYNVSPEEDNFILINSKLRWIMLDSWLHYFLGNWLEETIEDSLLDDEEDALPEEPDSMYRYDIMDNFVLSEYTPLLARQSKHWLAYVLGEDQEEDIPGMIFSNPESGFELAFGFNDLIPDARNHWHRGEVSEDDPEKDTLMMLQSPYISGRWMHYLLEHYDLPGIEFPGLNGRELLWENMDFMLRFWKRKGYFN